MLKATSSPTANLTLYVAQKPKIDNLVQSLDSVSTDKLLNFVTFTKLLFAVSKTTIDWSAYGDNSDISRKLVAVLTGRSKDRGGLMAATAILLGDIRNVKQVVDELPKEELRLWRKTITAGTVSETEVRNMLGIPTPGIDQFINKPRFSWLCPTSESVEAARWQWGYYKKMLRFEINELVRPQLIQVLFPSLYTDIYKKREPSEKLQKFCDTEGAVKAFVSLEALQATGVFDSMQTGKVTVQVIKSVSKAAGLSEFFPTPAEGDKGRLLARSRLTANLLLYMPKNKTTVATERMREVIKHIGGYNEDLVRSALMPQLHGKFSINSFDHNSMGVLRSVLDCVAAVDKGDKWIDIKGFLEYVQVTHTSRLGSALLSDYEFARADLRVKGWPTTAPAPAPEEPKKAATTRRRSKVVVKPAVDEHTIDNGERFKYLVTPLIKGAVFMLAALGCAEVAYDSTDDATFSPFAGLDSWRLTPLGRYVLCLADNYVCDVKVDTCGDFTLDDRYLLITVTKPASTMRGLLDRYAKLVSGNRYVVTAETFLRDCSTQKDIDAKVAMLRKFVCPEPPQVWLDFFDKLRGNVDAVGKDKTKYAIYKINPADKELQQYVAMSPEMRSIAICAQGFRVMVETVNDEKFRSLMRARGYLC